VYETQDNLRRRAKTPHEQFKPPNKNVNVDQIVPSFRITIWVSDPIEAVAQESTIAALANVDQTSLERPMALRLHLEACIVEVSDLWDTCSVLHHTACQPCRGTAYSASDRS
jgi:hypothetical protein